MQKASEKITINMNPVDLGKVDLLVEEGHYTNRTDFIRTAIRHQLERREEAVKASVARKEFVVGVLVHTKAGLEKRLAKGERLQIRVLGMVVIDDDVSPELAEATIDSLKVLGVLRASKAIKQALGERIVN